MSKSTQTRKFLCTKRNEAVIYICATCSIMDRYCSSMDQIKLWDDLGVMSLFLGNQIRAMLLLSTFPWWQFPHRKDIHPKWVLSLPNPIKLSKIQGSSAIRLHHGREKLPKHTTKAGCLKPQTYPILFFLLYNCMKRIDVLNFWFHQHCWLKKSNFV